MRGSELRKSKGKVLQIRPRARRFDESGAELPPVADAWRCEEVSDSRLTLINQRTDHRLCLPFDHVIEFRGDAERDDAGTLVLKTQVFLFGRKGLLEPMHPYRKGDTPLPNEIREARSRAITERIGEFTKALDAVIRHYAANPRLRAAPQRSRRSGG